MELQRYVTVLQRWSWLIVLIVVLTAVASAGDAIVAPGSYKATTQLLVNPISPPSATTDTYYYPPYYQEQAAQFILDDFAKVIEGTTFAGEIITSLKQSPQADVRAAANKMTTIDDALKLSKQLTVNRVNRLLQVDVTASSRDLALAIAASAGQLIAQQGPTFFDALTKASGAQGQATPAVTVGISDQPHITQKPSRLRSLLFWLLRTLVGLVAAAAIVLVLHYFDDHLYDEVDVRSFLDLPTLGSVVAPPLAVSRMALQRGEAAPRTAVGARG